MSTQLKFRYTFKHKIFKKEVSLYHFTLEEIEKGALIQVLNSGMIENGYELISRDQYVGVKDINSKEIYERDNIKCLKLEPGRNYTSNSEVLFLNSRGAYVEIGDGITFLRELGEIEIIEKQRSFK